MMGKHEIPFVEECIKIMYKGEHIVFKCPYETLSEIIAKELEL
jgi:hypothetical protein